MAQTLVKLSEKEDMVVNVVKGKFGLKNKNDAIRRIILEYEKHHLEDALKPAYVKELEYVLGKERKESERCNRGYA